MVGNSSTPDCLIGPHETEVIKRSEPLPSLADVEFATLAWVHWFYKRRILEPIGDIPPAEYETNYQPVSGASGRVR